MTTLVAGAAFDIHDFIATGSLAQFFESGVPMTATDSSFVVAYSDETISEELTLTGTFADYVDGYPTTGTLTAISYWLNGSTLITLSALSISVSDFTALVLNDDLAGLFAGVLAGADQLSGSIGNDVLDGMGGNDVVEGGDGDDALFGGDGNDTLRGGLGADELDGGAGDDFLSEASGDSGPYSNDIYNGGAGIDRVSYFNNNFGLTIDLRIDSAAQNTGVMGNDTLTSIEHVTATYQDDTLIGNDVGNWFWTFNGTDTLTGNGGDDLFTVGLGTKIINGGTGADTVEINDTAYEPAYTADGIAVSLFLQGEAQATGVGNWTLTSIENLTGFYGSDHFIGDNNSNILAGEGGDDTLIGNGGNDTLAGDGTFGLSSGNAGAITFYADITSATGNDHLDGGSGDDTLIGGAGDDVMIGGAGVDRLDGGEGSDIYSVASFSHHASAEIGDTGGAGTDELRFAQTGVAGTLILRAGDTGIERIVIGTGTGAMAAAAGTLAHNVDVRALGNAVEMFGNSGANILTATAHADALYGGNGADRFYANGSNDMIDGGRGADVMYGGTGDDNYIVDDLGDVPFELAGEGTDTVLASIAHTLKANVEHLTLTGIYSINGLGNDIANVVTGNSGANRLWGKGGDDTLTGNDGHDQLDGGSGNDTLIGGSGNDIYFVDSAADVIVEGSGDVADAVKSTIDWNLADDLENLELLGSSDINGIGNGQANTLSGNVGVNALVGLAGNDKIYGRGGNDIVDGGDGSDWLEGGAGQDEFYGGTGSDRFVFREGDFGGSTIATADIIHDFSHAEGDRIRLDLVDSNTSLVGTQDFVFIGTGVFTGNAGELRYEQTDGNTYVQGDTNGDSIADFIIRLDGLYGLETDYFLL